MRYNIERFDRKPLIGRRQYYFRIRRINNGQIVSQSEGVNNKDDRNRTANELADAMGRHARVVDV